MIIEALLRACIEESNLIHDKIGILRAVRVSTSHLTDMTDSTKRFREPTKEPTKGEIMDEKFDGNGLEGRKI